MLRCHKQITLRVITGLILVTMPLIAVQGQDSNPADAVKRAEQAGVESTLLQELTERAEQTGFPEQSLAAIIGSAADLANQGLPYSHIFNKTFEGLSKDISANRIEAKVTAIQERMNRAGDMLDVWLADNPDLPIENNSKEVFRHRLTIAISKINGNPAFEGTTRDILEHFSRGSLPSNVGISELATAIGALREMAVLTGPDQAGNIIIRGLRSGLPAESFQKLPSALHNNKLPAEALTIFVTGRAENGFPSALIPENVKNGFQHSFPPRVTPFNNPKK